MRLNATQLDWVGRSALAVAVITLVAAVVFRPLWRDEYWSAYYASPGLPLNDAINLIARGDVHPPLYYVLLRYWGMVSQSDIWLRGLNLALYAVLGPLCLWLLRPNRELRWMALLLLFATGYWFIFFGAELRMYALMLIACSVMTAAMVRAADEPKLMFVALFTFGGLLASASHVFGGIWTACAGLCTGVLMLQRGRWGHFLAWGAASVVAVAPLALWMLLFRPDHNFGDSQDTATSLLESLDLGWGQYSRALLVKTFGSNLPAFALLIIAGFRVLKRPKAAEALLWSAVILVTVLSFGIQLLYMPMMKERGFIVIVPALVMLMAMAVIQARDTGRAPRWTAAVVVYALIAPLLFAPETFKDREEIGKVADLMKSPACRGAEVGMYLRQTGSIDDYTEFATRRALAPTVGPQGITLADVQKLDAAGVGRVLAGGCPVKLVALTLPRGKDPEHQRMDKLLAGLGFGGERIEKLSFGQGRSVAFVSRRPVAP